MLTATREDPRSFKALEETRRPHMSIWILRFNESIGCSLHLLRAISDCPNRTSPGRPYRSEVFLLSREMCKILVLLYETACGVRGCRHG